MRTTSDGRARYQRDCGVVGRERRVACSGAKGSGGRIEKGNAVHFRRGVRGADRRAGKNPGIVDRFCEEAGIVVEWELKEKVWGVAGAAFQGYATRRRKHRGPGRRRLLADFLIRAHAFEGGYKLLTLDGRMYKAAFPRLMMSEV